MMMITLGRRGESFPKGTGLRNFYLYFAKIYGPPEILQFYTSAVVDHGGRGPIVARYGGTGPGPLAREHTAVGHIVRSLPPGGNVAPQVALQAMAECMDLPPCPTAVGFFW
jgi:hypothetical protein